MKKIISITLTAMLLTSLAAPVYAAENTSSTTDSVTFTTPDIQDTISLSLEDAVKKMQTEGVSAQAAELAKQEDQNVAKGYTETIRDINDATSSINQLQQVESNMGTLQYLAENGTDAQKAYANSVLNQYRAAGTTALEAAYKAQVAGATSGNRKIVDYRRTFATNNIENNYQADMNAIKETTVNLYYSVLLAQQNLSTAQDNQAAVKVNLDNIQKKVNAGTQTKKALLEAQSALEDAKAEVRADETTLNKAKMSFNYLMGYNVKQEVEFTTPIPTPAENTTDVETAVKNVLANRNEVKAADMAVDVYTLIMNNLRYTTSTNGSKYISAKLDVVNAQNTQKNTRGQLEVDIRNQYDALQDDKANLESAKSLLEYAKEGLRLVTATTDAGVTTAQDLIETQVKVYKAQLNLNKANMDYIVALETFEVSQGVGVYKISL